MLFLSLTAGLDFSGLFPDMLVTLHFNNHSKITSK
jgi:hypothetical protein